MHADPAPAAPAPEKKTGPSPGPGRPKGAKTRPKMPSSADQEPRRHGAEKPPPELTPDSRAAAIRREGRRLQELIDAEKATNPAAVHWRPVDSLFSKTGHRVNGSAWRPFVAIPVRLVERLTRGDGLGDGPAAVPDSDIDQAAQSWEDASIHLGLSESGAAWLGAVGSTLATVGVAVGRGLSAWWARRGSMDKPPAAAAEEKPN